MKVTRPLAEVVADLAVQFDGARRRLWVAVGLLADSEEPGELRALDDDFMVSTPRATAPQAALLLARATEARRALVEANVPLVRSLVRGRSDARELGQACSLALYKAADRFDPTRGAGFATCAKWWIRKAIQAAERARGPVSTTEHAVRAGRAARLADEAALLRLPDDGDDPEAIAIEAEEQRRRAEQLERLQAALDGLDPQIRRILLADAGGSDVDALGLPSARVRAMLAAGRRALALALGVDPSSPRRATHRGSARPLPPEFTAQGDLFGST